MTHLTIFGQHHLLLEQKSNKDHIEQKSSTIIVNKHKKTAKKLLNEHLTQLLYGKLLEIYDNIKAEGKVELFGDFDFEIAENIDNKKTRIAKLKGNKTIIKLNAIALPENILRYIVAHEVAHIENKRHTSKFWKTVGLICPNFREAQQQLTNLGKEICFSQR